MLDLDRLRQEKADAGGGGVGARPVGRPGHARRRSPRELSYVKGEIDKLERLRARLDDAGVLLELAEAEDDAGVARRGRHRDHRAAQGDRRAGGPHAALRRVRLPGGAGRDPGRRRRRRRGRLRRDAAADVPALGRAARLPDRGLRHLLRRGGGPQVGDVRGQGARTRTARCRSSPARTGWCGSARSTTRAAGRPASPASRCCRSSSRPTTSTSRTNDMRVDVYRSSGPGGQSVNTTDSAVRITHLPDRHRGDLPEREVPAAEQGVRDAACSRPSCWSASGQEEQAKMDGLQDDAAGSWGDQMRSYVLHPYQMVKDLRTEHETGNPSAVFDGDLDELHRGRHPLAQAAAARGASRHARDRRDAARIDLRHVARNQIRPVPALRCNGRVPPRLGVSVTPRRLSHP